MELWGCCLLFVVYSLSDSGCSCGMILGIFGGEVLGFMMGFVDDFFYMGKLIVF